MVRSVLEAGSFPHKSSFLKAESRLKEMSPLLRGCLLQPLVLLRHDQSPHQSKITPRVMVKRIS